MLYEQGNKKIEIVIRKESSSNNGANEISAEDTAGTTKTWRTALFGSENQSRINRVIKTNATHFLAVSKQALNLGIQYAIGGLGYKYGDQTLQESVSREWEIISDTANIASSISMGALYGSWGGPIGAVMGAVMGAVSSGMSTAVKYMGRERDFNYKVFKENNAIEYQRARASINLTTGRLR